MINNIKIEQLSFRNYVDADYNAVKEILIDAELLDAEWDRRDLYARRVDTKPDSIVVAELDGKIVGNIILVDDLYPFVFRLSVKSEYRKRGIGKKLMEESIKRLKSHGHNEIGLFVDDSSETLKKWYKKQGFNISKPYRGMWKKI